MDGFVGDLLQRFSFCYKKEQEKMNISVVCLYSIFRIAFLGDQVMEKKLFSRNKLLWEGFSGDGRVE